MLSHKIKTQHENLTSTCVYFQPNPLQGSSPPDHTVTFEMFDRVVNVREGFSVPLGARGTIIGVCCSVGGNLCSIHTWPSALECFPVLFTGRKADELQNNDGYVCNDGGHGTP